MLWRFASCRGSNVAGSRQKGFTLLEMAIVLGVSGLVFSAIWSVVSTAWSAYQFRVMNEQLMTVVQNVRNYFDPIGAMNNPLTGAPFADGASITAFLDNDARRLIPVNMRTTRAVAGSRIHHAISSMAVSAVDGSFSVYSMNGGDNFRVLLAGLDRTDCIKMLLEFPFLTPEVGVTSVDVNGAAQVIDTTNPAVPPAGFPMTASVASAWCNAVGKINGVGIVFELRN